MEENQTNLDISTAILLVYGKILIECNYSSLEIRGMLNDLSNRLKVYNYTFVVADNSLILINSLNNSVKMINGDETNFGYNFEKITLARTTINAYSQKKMNEDDLLNELQKIEKNNHNFSDLTQILSAGLICASMYVVINKLSSAVIAAMIIGALTYCVYLYFKNKLKIGLLSTFIYSLIVSMSAYWLYNRNFVADPFSLTLSCLMPLLPGATLVNSIKASINGDYIFGLSQGAYAIITIMLLVLPVVFILSNA